MNNTTTGPFNVHPQTDTPWSANHDPTEVEVDRVAQTIDDIVNHGEWCQGTQGWTAGLYRDAGDFFTGFIIVASHTSWAGFQIATPLTEVTEPLVEDWLNPDPAVLAGRVVDLANQLVRNWQRTQPPATPAPVGSVISINAENGDGEDLGYDVTTDDPVEALTEWVEHFGLDEGLDGPLTLDRLRVSVPELEVNAMTPDRSQVIETYGRWEYWTVGKHVESPRLDNLLVETGRVDQADRT